MIGRFRRRPMSSSILQAIVVLSVGRPGDSKGDMGGPPVVPLRRNQHKRKRLGSEFLQRHSLDSFPGFFSGGLVGVAGEALPSVFLAMVDFSPAVEVEGASFFAASLYELLR
jgi:hypothetical protein